MRTITITIALLFPCVAYAKPKPVPAKVEQPKLPEYMDARDAVEALAALHDAQRAQGVWLVVKAQLERKYQISVDAGDGWDPDLRVRRLPKKESK